MAESARQIIRDEVKNRNLSALFDIATLNNRSILGVSLQYSINGKLKVRSIGMVELTESHTAKYLGEVVIKRLNEFNIGLRQIISMTKDNGANVSKMVRDMDDNLKSCLDAVEKENPIFETTEILNEEDVDNDIAQALNECDMLSDEDHLAILF